MSKTINQLSNLETYKGNNVESLDSIYNKIIAKVDWCNGSNPNLQNWKNRLATLFSENDFLLVSHQMSQSPQDYVAFKVPLSTYEAVMHSIRLDALSSEISASLKLGDLAWKNDLGLQDLAYQNTITVSQIEDLIPLNKIATTWGDLLSTDRNDLKLSALASKSQIKDEDVADDAKIKCSKIDGLGNLATTNRVELGLSHMASRSHIDLGLHKRVGLSEEGTYDVDGMLDQKYIANPYRYTLPHATDHDLGGIKVGFSGHDKGEYYAVQLSSSNDKAYVNVPWTDSILNVDKFEGRSTGNNSFSIELKYSTADKSANNRSPTLTTTTKTADITLTPTIPHNVILKGETPHHDSVLNNSIAVFSSGNTTDLINVTKGPTIYPNNNNDNRYLKINGEWAAIPDATDQQKGLLAAEDKEFIDNLKNKGDYILPAASKSTLGGIKLPNFSPADVMAYYSFSTESVISLPLRVTTGNVAYVNIPSRLADASSFNTAAATAANTSIIDKLKELYPKGAIYITTAATCPLETIITGSKWDRIYGRYLLASGPLAGTNNESYAVSPGQISTVEAALPNHSHYVSVGKGNCTCQNVKSVKNHHGDGTNYAYVSGIAGFATSQTVRTPAFVVNVFIRVS